MKFVNYHFKIGLTRSGDDFIRTTKQTQLMILVLGISWYQVISNVLFKLYRKNQTKLI